MCLACNLHWAGWNDEFVVFDEASGQTHQLDAVHALILQLLMENVQTLSDVLQIVSDTQVFPDSVHLDGQIESIFNEFVAVGLVEAVAQ